MKIVKVSKTFRVIAIAFLCGFLVAFNLPFFVTNGRRASLARFLPPVQEEKLQILQEPEAKPVPSTPNPINPYKKVINKNHFAPRTNYTQLVIGTKFWKAKPSYTCPKKLLKRVGNRRGGKYVCGLETLGNLTEKGYKCTVYSFGVGNDSSFEAEVLQSTHCKIFAFDPNATRMGKPFRKKTSNLRVKLIKTIAGKEKSLKVLMNELQHKFVDILKVDGYEQGLEQMLKDFRELPFGQLQIKIDIGDGKNAKRMLDLLRNLEGKGARVFSIKSIPSCKRCAQYALINLDYLKLFIP